MYRSLFQAKGLCSQIMLDRVNLVISLVRYLPPYAQISSSENDAIFSFYTAGRIHANLTRKRVLHVWFHLSFLPFSLVLLAFLGQYPLRGQGWILLDVPCLTDMSAVLGVWDPQNAPKKHSVLKETCPVQSSKFDAQNTPKRGKSAKRTKRVPFSRMSGGVFWASFQREGVLGSTSMCPLPKATSASFPSISPMFQLPLLVWPPLGPSRRLGSFLVFF